MRRDWMSSPEAAALVARCGGRDTLELEAERLEWVGLEEGGVTVGAMPGAGINECIRELRIPRVSAVAVGSLVAPADDAGEGFYPGLYGIEGNYSNGRVRVHVIDAGTFLRPVFCDVFELEPAGV